MVKIGIIGFGVVGSGVYEVIRKNKDSIARKAGNEIDVKYILDIRDFSSHSESHLFVNNFDKMVEDDEVSIIVETMGGLEPAYEYTKRALSAGKSVVTSNKELVATYGDELLKIAYDNGCAYLFEASVGGGIPIIRPLNQCLAANEIGGITGILNGTTNYILTQMIKSGQSFEEALKDAQDLGYAERNPSADVDGHDACRKICILTSLATGKKIEYKKVYTEGITAITLRDVEYAGKFGSVIKLIGMSRVADNGSVTVMVAPMIISAGHPLATVEGVNNAIMVDGNAIGSAMFYGPGAGKLPTASAVVADVIDIAKTHKTENRLLWVKADGEVIAPQDEAEFKYFVRIKGSYSEAQTKIREVFGECVCINLYNDEFGFVTENMAEGKLKSAFASLPYEVIGFIRVLS